MPDQTPAGPSAAWCETFLEAARSFAELVTALPADLSGPGLGEWDLRALVGHTARSLTTVSTYLRQPADEVVLNNAADYIGGLAGVSTDSCITQRGVEAGRQLGADPSRAVQTLLDAVTADLTDADPEQIVSTYAGGMRLRDYLPTRTFELVVHGLDIDAAAAVGWTPPPQALAEAVGLAAEVAVRRGEGPRLLRLLTGRDPGGISIL